MAKLKTGLTQLLSGTLGPLVICNLNGTVYVRKRPNYDPAKRTPKQEAILLKYALAAPFLQSIKELARQSFFDPRPHCHGNNSARSFFVRNAFTGGYPNLVPNYEMAYVAYGNIPVADNARVSVNGAALDFSWTSSPHPGIARPDDLAILVAFDMESNSSFYSVGAATRSMHKASLPVFVKEGQSVHTWLAFHNASGTDASISVYTGLMTF